MRILLPLHLIAFLCIISLTAESQSYRKVSNTPPSIIHNEKEGQPKSLTAARSPEKIQKCGFAYIMNQAKAKGFNEQAYETFMRKLIEKRKVDGIAHRSQSVVTIPVIFHVISVIRFF